MTRAQHRYHSSQGSIPLRFEFFGPHLRYSLSSTCMLVITLNLVSMRIGRVCYTS